MSKVKYKYNTKSLTYEKVEPAFKDFIKKALSYLATGTVFAAITIFIAYTYFDSPKELQLKREIELLSLQYEIINNRMNQTSTVLQNLQERDDNIYRVIFEAEPIPNNIRKAGFGGAERYKELEGYDNSRLIIETSAKLDQITKQLYIQSKSFDEVAKMVENKNTMLSSIPAIQPIANHELTRFASGFGRRTHPIYKIAHFHTGVDFSASVGTKIYATGDGKVEKAENLSQGYGHHVIINHDYGYQTLYGHMSRIAVRPGQKVKRGDVIGYVGSTGLSTAPHLHYEVIKNGQKINPVNFFYNDLSPEEFAQMIEISSKANQTFD